jgi:hypothetical protein
MVHPVVYLSSASDDDLTKASACQLLLLGAVVVSDLSWVEYSKPFAVGMIDVVSLAEVLVERCDAVVLVPGWESSELCRRIRDTAESYAIDTFTSIDDLARVWSLK